MSVQLKTVVLFVSLIVLVNTKPRLHNADDQTKVEDRAFWQFSYQMANIFGAEISAGLLDYGCYCGLNGKGTPKDGLDRCCQAHDRCYGTYSSWWCWPKFVSYDYNFVGNSIKCNDNAGSCSHSICMCDKVFIECVHVNTYHPENYNVDATC